MLEVNIIWQNVKPASFVSKHCALVSAGTSMKLLSGIVFPLEQVVK
jgi:hypothetical protein